MRVLKNFRDGVTSYLEAIQLIFSRGLWYFYLFPVVIQVGLIIGSKFLHDNLIQTDFGTLPEKDYEYQILFVGLKCVFFFATAKLTNSLVLMVLSPALTRLSYHTEFLITGNTYPSTWKQYIKDVDRAYRIIFRNMLLQMAWIMGWYLITLPFPGSWSSRWIFVFIIGAYFYGFSLIDYNSERLRLNTEESIKFVRKHFALSWSLGAIYYMLFAIPYVGVVIGPVTAVVAATIAVDKTIDLSKNPHATRASANAPPPAKE